MTNSKKCTEFGMKIKIALIQNDLSSQELAKRMKCSNSTISDVIYGRNMNKKTKATIAKELGIEE